jgi:hypothetical protein
MREEILRLHDDGVLARLLLAAAPIVGERVGFLVGFGADDGRRAAVLADDDARRTTELAAERLLDVERDRSAASTSAAIAKAERHLRPGELEHGRVGEERAEARAPSFRSRP